MGALRCYYSGVEGTQHFNAVVRAGGVHVLLSYLYMEKADPDLVKKRKQKHPHLRFMIDSGAHTFQSDKAKYSSWKLTEWEAYIQRYVKWLRANRAYIEAGVELDIDWVVGPAVVEQWQKKYFIPLLEEGIPIIFVWHKQRGLDGWEEMCSRFSYVGLPGEFSSLPDFNKYMAVARKYTTRVHGFAASVVGESKVLIETALKRRVYLPIADLFKWFPVSRRTDVDEWVDLPSGWKAWTLTNDLQPAMSPVTAVVRHTLDKAIYRICLRGGKTITGTDDHSFFVLTPQGTLREVTPLQLAPGDHLVSSCGFPASSTPAPFDSATAEFYGVWFGDGYINRKDAGIPRAIWVSKQHQPAIRATCRSFCSKRGLTWTVVPDSVDGYVCSTEEASQLAAYFGHTGSEKNIGSAIWSAPRDIQAAFLRGYFSADGCAKGRNRLVSLTCFRREILEDVQLLLEGFDIRSGISKDSLSGKGSQTWELAISDAASLELFAAHIGFLQDDQTAALTSKLGKKAVPGCHRGLPITLLSSGKVFRRSGPALKGYAPSSSSRSRASLYAENFEAPLRNMTAEYMEVVSVEKVSSGGIPVYDLCVPATERFFANGILAHNTKQTDFRDWDWYSSDSTTWKSSERYGTLIHWDKHNQRLIYDEDKSNRPKYRKHFEEAGLDADAIIADTNYREFTTYALFSMRKMEEFYEQKFAERIRYYELRLPHPKAVSLLHRKALVEFWRVFRPQTLFPQEGKDLSESEIRWRLQALAAVQYRCVDWIEQRTAAREFLARYFPKMLENNKVLDPVLFQKELSAHVSPPNPPPLRRLELLHYAPLYQIKARPPIMDDELLDPMPTDEELALMERL